MTAFRFLIAGAGIAAIVGGLALVYSIGIEGAIPALWLLGLGAVLLIVAAIEVTRYRSEQAERHRLDPGTGGGEQGPLEPRFKRTDETFVDPTTSLRMRVFMDPATGERRYIAE